MKRTNKGKPVIRTLTDEEDSEITAAALTDPDNPPWTDEQLSRAVPAYVLHPEMRPAQVREGKPASQQ
jgi:hypothetical protein